MLLSEAEIKLNSIDKDNAPIPGRNKGGRGLWVEEQLGMKQSSQLNDFEDGELKAFKEGQTIAVTMVQHCLDEIFDKSLINETTEDIYDHIVEKTYQWPENIEEVEFKDKRKLKIAFNKFYENLTRDTR